MSASDKSLLQGDAGEEARIGLADRGLRIAKVEPFCLKWPGTRYWSIIVRVETEEGIVGFGEASGHPLSPIVATINSVGSALVGESAWGLERLWALERDNYTHGSVMQAAFSALDIAFWDIIGKKLNVPVYALLGGKLNERIRVYHHPFDPAVDSLADCTRMLVAEGVTAGKLDPFNSEGYSRELTSSELEEAVQAIRSIREAGGPDFTICVEMHARFNVATAIRVADALRPYAPLFLEEPVPSEDVAAMREVQRATPLAVATGERIRTTTEYGHLLEQRACRILQPDIGHMGGITGLKRLAHMADDHYVTIAPHCCWGPVHSMASAQVCCTIPNFLIQEDVWLWTDAYAQTVVGGYSFDPQYLDVPNAPGIGVCLPQELITEYAIDPLQWDRSYYRSRLSRGGGGSARSTQSSRVRR